MIQSKSLIATFPPCICTRLIIFFNIDYVTQYRCLMFTRVNDGSFFNWSSSSDDKQLVLFQQDRIDYPTMDKAAQYNGESVQ